MSYTGDGEVSAQLRPGGSVETLRVGATTARLVATGDLTAGRFGLFQWDMPAEAGGAKPLGEQCSLHDRSGNEGVGRTKRDLDNRLGRDLVPVPWAKATLGKAWSRPPVAPMNGPYRIATGDMQGLGRTFRVPLRPTPPFGGHAFALTHGKVIRVGV